MSSLNRIAMTAIVGFAFPATLLLAQNESRRSYHGWGSVSTEIKQTAFYQTQGGLPDVNSLPSQPVLGSTNNPSNLNTGQAFPALPQSYSGAGTLTGNPGGSGNSPPNPTLLPQNPGYGTASSAAPQQIPSGPVPGGQYPAATSRAAPMAGRPSASVMPPGQQFSATPGPNTGGYASSGAASSGTASAGTLGSGPLGTRPIMPVNQTTSSNNAYSNNSYPNNAYSNNSYPNNGSSGNLAGQTIGYQQPTSDAQGNRLRGIDGSASPTGRYDPNTVTSGPPFVAPPPRSRYPTSPYNRALFQTVAYQRAQSEALVAASVPAGGNMHLANTQIPGSQTYAPQAPTAQPALQTGLQATPGIYPTAAYQCQPAPTLPAGSPAAYVPGTITPDLAPTVYSGKNAGLKPLFSLGQENYNVQLGRGIVGQPTVYVPKQPIRNFFRYIFP